ncbi:DUF2630 family protein [Oryzihumus sp.]
MDDSDVLARVRELVAEEHRLRQPGVPELERARLAGLETELDQCWDLLRQRQARRDAGASPDAAEVRPVDQVESYLQ